MAPKSSKSNLTPVKKAHSQADLDRRKLVGVNAETVTDITSTDFPGHYPGEDHAWDVKQFRETCSVEFHHNNRYDCSFSLKGIDASVANAYRRILIAELPSLAIEKVLVSNNTSIIQDEVLCHRLGLVPLKGGPGIFEWLRWSKMADPENHNSESPWGVDSDTVVLNLKIECTRNDKAAKGETDPLKAYHNAHVYARDIQFTPFGRQEMMFSGENAIVPTNPDILVAKLRHGQCIDVEMHAIKGVGKDHAKFSPVATATYRLLPTIRILQPILGKDAEKFATCFPKGVIELKTVTQKEAATEGSGYEGHAGEKKAVVKNTMKDTVSRECLRHPEFEKKVKLGRVRDHFIFSVESVGQWDSDTAFLESVKILRTKCEMLKQNLANMAR